MRWARAAMVSAAVCASAAYVALGVGHQWDFETYYVAATACRAGLDPYNLHSLGVVAGHPVDLPFLYPPVTLVLFMPFTYLSLGNASIAWLMLKGILVGFLVRSWMSEFLPSVPRDVVLTTTVLGFDLALLWDFRTGNVALLEQFLLWMGFLAFVRRRVALAAPLISAAAVFKIHPILFLGLLLPMAFQQRRLRLVGAYFVGFLGVVAIPLVPAGSWGHALAMTLPPTTFSPATGPSLPTILAWFLSVGRVDVPIIPRTVLVLYSLCVGVLLLVSWRGMRRVLHSANPVNGVVTLLILSYLISPRVMVYSYVSAVVPALYVIYGRIDAGIRRNLAVGVLLSEGIVRLLPGEPPVGLGIISFLSMLGVWSLWLGPKAQGPPAEDPLPRPNGPPRVHRRHPLALSRCAV